MVFQKATKKGEEERLFWGKEARGLGKGKQTNLEEVDTLFSKFLGYTSDLLVNGPKIAFKTSCLPKY